MRLAAGGLAAAALLCAAAPAGAEPRALVAFIPTEPAPRLPLLFDVAERGMAYGVTSPTLGGYSKRQMMLDVSQGSRIARGAYPERDPPRVDLVRDGAGARISNWDEVLERADDAPGDVLPGLFADELRRSGRAVAFAGIVGFEQIEAIGAADRAGRIGEVSLGTFGTFSARLAELWERAEVVVARFPADDRGLEALDRVLAARAGEDLVYVVRAPPAGSLRLLPTGVAGPGYEGAITSDTTRQVGLVAATDIAPTVLDHLGLDVPSEMDGQVVEPDGAPGPEKVRERVARIDIVLSRRGQVLTHFFIGCMLLVGLLAFARGDGGLRTGLRISFLAAFWLPGVALAAGALAPEYRPELFGSALAALALGALTDRLVPWPGAPAVPVAAVLVAHTVDLAFGSPLIGASVFGPNPEGGARFYGIGNELESILSVMVLLGAGAALSVTGVRRPALAFALICLAAAVVIGAGRLGADVGGVITLGAGAAGAILALQPGGPSRRAIVLAVLAPVAGVVLLIAIDLLTGGGAHLTRTVLEGEGSGEVLEIVTRRLGLSLEGLRNVARFAQVAAAVALVVWGYRNRQALFGPVWDREAFRAGLAGAFAATVVGALANDSGPVIFVTGTVALLLAAGYVQGRPDRGGAPAMRRGAISRNLPAEAPPARLP